MSQIIVNGRLTKRAQPQGAYRATTLDAAKKAADFRVLDVGNKYTIEWRNGTRERVTERQLAKLQAAHTWQTDF